MAVDAACCCHHHRPVLPAVAVSTLACFESLLQCLYCCVCASCIAVRFGLLLLVCFGVRCWRQLSPSSPTQQPPPTVLPFWCFALVVRHASSVMDCILLLVMCALHDWVRQWQSTCSPSPSPLRMCGGVHAAARGSCGHRSGGCCTCL